MKLKRPRTCLGCRAHEEGNGPFAKDYCRLGYDTHSIDTVAGFYGRNGALIGCRCAPTGPCPKPITTRQYVQAMEICTLKEIRDFPVHSEPIGCTLSMQEIANAALAGGKK